MIGTRAWFFQFGGSVTVTAGKENTLHLAYILGFFGFGVKAAVFPGHKWLLRPRWPHAGDRPAPRGGGGEGGGVRGGPDHLVRLRTRPAPGELVPVSGHGAAHVHHCLRLLQGPAHQASEAPSAWSTVSNLSYILLGIATLTTAGLVAGMVHMVVHAVLKITLFFGVGAVHYKLHRDFVPDVEGCGVLMPVCSAPLPWPLWVSWGCPPWRALPVSGCWPRRRLAWGSGSVIWGGGPHCVRPAHRPVPHGDRSAGLFPQAEPAAHRPGAQAGPAGPLLADDRPPDRAVCGVGGPGPGGGRFWSGRSPCCWGYNCKIAGKEGREWTDFCCFRCFFLCWPACLPFSWAAGRRRHGICSCCRPQPWSCCWC